MWEGDLSMKLAFTLLLAVCAAATVSWACGGDSTASSTSTPKSDSVSPTSVPANASTSASPTSGGGSASTAKLPADACALLTADDVHKLAPTAGEGKNTSKASAGSLPGVSCRWEWAEGISSLDVTVSSLPAGSAGTFKTSLQAEVKSPGRELSGMGDFAIVKSSIAADVTVRVLIKGLLVDVDLNGLGARDKMELVVALAKAAIARL